MLITLLTAKIKNAIQELDEWTHNKPQHLTQGIQKIREELIEAKLSTSIESLREKTNIISMMIVDSGPLDVDFLPSFQEIVKKLGKLNN